MGILLDSAVVEIITKLVANPRFASLMQEKINLKVDTAAIEQEIEALEKQLKQAYATKRKILEEIEQMDPDDRNYDCWKEDLDNRLYRMYDKINGLESSLIEAKAKKFLLFLVFLPAGIVFLPKQAYNWEKEKNIGRKKENL